MFEVDGLILDMDGVLWRGSEPMPGLARFFEVMRQQGIEFILATNNSTRTVEQYVGKLAGMGVRVLPERILTSACAAADYLLALAEPGAGVFTVGEEGLERALESRGFCLTAERAKFVVAGLDRAFDYQKMATATALIRNGARYIGTNPDLTLPTPEGLLPGAGAVLAAITAACGVEPTIIGKPEPLMLEQALGKLGTEPGRTFVVGDRLETDILGGQNTGVGTILVLSGASKREELAESAVRPDWVLEDIRALSQALEAKPESGLAQ